ncbi:hypothetical protein VIGAN_08012200 [Vigna angularis var. angularis]|uniref:Uncharacterized protein n=1 Tax=Vigna angularis var. angularis TaxID=157739 RepID=A0A0S3SLA3_PHAAN|nr:hypothetical protein VIGAN_08012200 [Vigna angularis var. angularis]
MHHASHRTHEVYCSYTPSPSSANCMLSLGTPSTRFTEGKDLRNRHEPRSSVTNFRWNLRVRRTFERESAQIFAKQ